VIYVPPETASDIQRRMYEFIVQYIRENGTPPTNREIGSALNIASIGHVDYHLTMLEKKGLITRQQKKSRGIKLTKTMQGIPVMGAIAAGQPLEIFSDPDQFIDVGHELEQEDHYALIVKGNSMIEDYICDGDFVVVKPQPSCESGNIVVAVHLEGVGRATVKRFFEEKEYNRIRLQPANSDRNPIYISKAVWNQEWQVQGKAVEVLRRFGDTIPTRRIRVFLCHSSGDKLAVRQLYQRLKACNLDPWLDEENLLPGQDWEEEIRKAVQEADVVIVCLSRGSISKTGFVQKEIKFALNVAEEKPEGVIFIIPLLLEECTIPERLSRWQAVKYFEQDGFDKLMKTFVVNISL